MERKKFEATISLEREKLAECRELTPEMKLTWLEEANNFIHAIKKRENRQPDTKTKRKRQ